MRRITLGSFALACAVACTSPGADLRDAGADGLDAITFDTLDGAIVETSLTSDASSEPTVDDGARGDGGASCVIPLVVSYHDDVPDRIHVPVTYDGAARSLLLDTGSGMTFFATGADEPEYEPDYGRLTIGCDMYMFPARGIDPPEDIPGRPCIGFMGIDMFVERVSMLDLDRGELTFDVDPRGTEGWPTIPIELVGSAWVAELTVDGTPLRMIVDTGSPHVLWVGQPGRPGDREYIVHDAKGQEVTLFEGDSVVEIAGMRMTIPVTRTPSFPYLEGRIEGKGGNLHGLVGMSVLGRRRVLVDGLRDVLRLEPRETPR